MARRTLSARLLIPLTAFIVGVSIIWQQGFISASRSRGIKDLYRTSIPARTVIEIDMKPFAYAYWTAELSNKDTRVPIYPHYKNRRRATLFCPVATTFELTVRIPVPKKDSQSRDADPPACLIYKSAGPKTWSHGWARVLALNSTSTRQIFDYCDADGEEFPGIEGAYKLGSKDPPDILGHANSIVYSTTVVCSPQREVPDIISAMQQMSKFVYGPAASSFQYDGAISLGYWFNNGQVGRTKGSLSYVPQPAHCSLTFQRNEIFKTHQEKCEGQENNATFHWTPYAHYRADWLLTPESLEKCFKGPEIRLIGDSIMLQYYRGMDCLRAGYAALDIQDVQRILAFPSILDPFPFFAPPEAKVQIDDKEADKLIAYHQPVKEGFEQLPTTPGIEILFQGMWQVPHLPTRLFKSGLKAWFKHVKRRSDELGISTYVALLTSPSSEPDFPTQPGWQTADRVYEWNKILMEEAVEHGFGIIDLFFPTTNRFDARTDNAHSCDSLNVETSFMLLKAICSD